MRARRFSVELGWGAVSCLEWTAEGRAAGTLLLLHGGGLDSAQLSWGELGPALARTGWRILAPDHPGYGESAPAPWPATQDRLVEYVGELVGALGLERYALGGLSLGGGMTLGHVLRAPEGVSGALLFGSYGLMDYQFAGPLRGPLHTLTWMLLRVGALDALSRAYGRDPKRMAGAVKGIIRNPAQRTPELLDAVMEAARRHPAAPAFAQWQRDQILWNRLRTNYSGQLDSVRLPVLVVHGDRDTGVPVAAARLAAERFPRGRLLEIPDAGHWVQRDRPDVVLPAVLEFLGSLGGNAEAADLDGGKIARR